MDIMKYIPQFGAALGGGTQDVSGIPQDDMLQQLMLKRKLAQAEALKNAEVPQGQMVSGRYVPPSWTQYLANAVGKYQAGKQERDAMKEYGQFQSNKQKKMADLLAGKEVETPVDYTDAGNMPGMTQTVRQPYSQQEFTARAVQAMPELAGEMVKAQLAQYGKEETPISLSEGAKLVNRKGQVLAENLKTPKEQEMFGKVNPQDFTPASLARFAQSGGKDYSLLEPTAKPSSLQSDYEYAKSQGFKGNIEDWKKVSQQAPTSYFQALPTAQGYAQFNARTGQIAPLPMGGQAVLPAAQSPQLQGQIAGAKFEGEAQAKRGFNMAGAPDIVNEARNILAGKVKPTGSGVGTIADIAGAAVGYSPRGAAEADQLRAISGQLVAKMPRMEGPQSDRDVQLYTQMAGQIGDSTIPVARRLQALKTVEGIITKYAPQQSKGMSAQDQQALQWAASNPNDPRAVAIKRKLGVQ